MLNPANRSINTTTYITQLDRPVSLPSPPNSFFTSFIHNGICTLRHQPRPPGWLAVHSARRLAHCYLSNRWCQNTDSLFLATGQGSSLLVRCKSSIDRKHLYKASSKILTLSIRARSTPNRSLVSSVPLRTSLVFASGSRTRDTLSSPPPTRRARAACSRRRWLTLKSLSPLRKFLHLRYKLPMPPMAGGKSRRQA